MLLGNSCSRGRFFAEDSHWNYQVDTGLSLLALDGTTAKKSAEKPISTQAIVSLVVAQILSEVAEVDVTIVQILPHLMFFHDLNPILAVQRPKERGGRCEPMAV